MATGPQPALEPQIPVTPQPPRKLRLVELCFVIFFGTFSPYLSTIYTITHGFNRTPADMNFRLAQMIGYELLTLALVTYILYRRTFSWRHIGFRPQASDLIVGGGLFVSGFLLARIVAVNYY